jgi:hemolysin III
VLQSGDFNCSLVVDFAKTLRTAMPTDNEDPARRALHEERVNAITHGCGLLLSVAAAVVLLSAVSGRGDLGLMVGCAIYSATLIGVFGASTLSHHVKCPKARQLWRRWDQGLIYLLIAGSFTPFALAYLVSDWWWLLVVLTWTLAIAGFVSKVVLRHRVNAVSTLSYLAVGWITIIGIGPVLAAAPMAAVVWFSVGAACYMAGIVFLVFDNKAIYLHAVWHVFVIAGSAFQFVSIYRCMMA